MAARHALCVGINAYPNAPLQGCVNDANDWAKVLTETGYMVTTLLDRAATSGAIIDTLKGLVQKARFGDRIVFTYSGHGSWVPDRNGDESDGRDEVLCAVNYEYGGYITDDEIQEIIDLKKFGVRVTVISDSCHSGSVNRLVGLVPHVDYRKSRFIHPGTFLPGSQIGRIERIDQREARTAPRATSKSVLFSGCGDEEYSYDAYIRGRYNGAFTEAAVSALRKNPGINPPTYNVWHKAVRAVLPNESYPQTPQFYGTRWQRSWRL